MEQAEQAEMLPVLTATTLCFPLLPQPGEVAEVLLTHQATAQTLPGCLAVLVVVVDIIPPLLAQGVPETRQALPRLKEIMGAMDSLPRVLLRAAVAAQVEWEAMAVGHPLHPDLEVLVVQDQHQRFLVFRQIMLVVAVVVAQIHLVREELAVVVMAVLSAPALEPREPLELLIQAVVVVEYTEGIREQAMQAAQE